jgi:hypothetical protein
MKLSHYKKYCPLEKNIPMEQLSDFVFRCISCGYKVDERQGDTALHNRVLIAKPSIYEYGKKYVIKEGQSRSEYFRKIRKEFENPMRYDKDSMYAHDLKPGMTSQNQWMNVKYCNMSLDYTEEELSKMFAKHRK